MSLADYYKRQFAWRDWPAIFAALPPLKDQLVLDLGCGVGDQAAEMVARGADVLGIDMNEEVLREARAKGLPRAAFRLADLGSALDMSWPSPPSGSRLGRPQPLPWGEGNWFDGVWCSFGAAYFPDLPAILRLWAESLRPGGWIALTEIDDFFGHEPVGERTRSLFDAYAREALAAGRYDFHMGRKLGDYLRRSGFAVAKEFTVRDDELSFDGPARPEVVDAWQTRLDGMKLLRDFCGPDFEALRSEFLECLTRPDHRCRAKVYCCVATKLQ